MNNKKICILSLIIIIMTGCSLFPSRATVSNKKLPPDKNTAQFHFLDVGQGDCTLITSGNTVILIDAGTYESGGEICEYIKNLGINSIDYFIGTHPHEDHLGGAAAVMTMFEVKNVFLNGEMSSSYFFEKLVDVMIDKNITPVVPEIGKTYKCGDISFKVISPQQDFGDENNNSLITKVMYKDISALFTGDCERVVESYLINHNRRDLPSDILKVGHHGSRNASSMEFLECVYPSVAVIQCGEGNSYGHPHDETLSRLKAIRTKVFRTDKDKCTVISTDGKKLYQSSEEIKEQKSEDSDTSKNLIANTKSKVYHLPSCKGLPAQHNRIYFSTHDEALKSGYKPCGNCNP